MVTHSIIINDTMIKGAGLLPQAIIEPRIEIGGAKVIANFIAVEKYFIIPYPPYT